jgi:hypothetical protein
MEGALNRKTDYNVVKERHLPTISDGIFFTVVSKVENNHEKEKCSLHGIEKVLSGLGCNVEFLNHIMGMLNYVVLWIIQIA